MRAWRTSQHYSVAALQRGFHLIRHVTQTTKPTNICPTKYFLKSTGGALTTCNPPYHPFPPWLA